MGLGGHGGISTGLSRSGMFFLKKNLILLMIFYKKLHVHNGNESKSRRHHTSTTDLMGFFPFKLLKGSLSHSE